MPHKAKHHTWLGIVLLMMAGLCFATLDTISKQKAGVTEKKR